MTANDDTETGNFACKPLFKFRIQVSELELFDIMAYNSTL